MKPRSPLTVAPIIDSVNTLSKKDTIMDAIMGKRYFFFTGGATSLASCVICTPVVCAPPTPIPKWPPLNPTPVPAVLVSIVDAPPRKATENLWMFSDPHCGQEKFWVALKRLLVIIKLIWFYPPLTFVKYLYIFIARFNLGKHGLNRCRILLLKFLCIARNNLTRIASYLRKVMTKLCIKILVKSDSAI